MKLHGEGGECEDVFEAGVACSAKTMYPDWLSMTGKGYIASMYKQYGKVISPMGCRAFLVRGTKEAVCIRQMTTTCRYLSDVSTSVLSAFIFR